MEKLTKPVQTKATQAKIYLLDNFDSFTYNLVDEFKALGFELSVYRNNIPAQIIKDKMDQETGPVILVLSPGPGSPSQAGSLLDLIDLCKGQYPMFGICLGHQALVEYFGGTIGRAGETIHGKSSAIDLIPLQNSNDETATHPVFNNLPTQLNVARYHSLMATNVPNELTVIAQYQSERSAQSGNPISIPMAVINEDYQMLGLQFHPESILTTQGATLIEQSLDYISSNFVPRAAVTSNQQPIKSA